MKIVKRIHRGALKGYTIRQSKFRLFALYSKNSVSQTSGKITKEQVFLIVRQNNKR